MTWLSTMRLQFQARTWQSLEGNTLIGMMAASVSPISSILRHMTLPFHQGRQHWFFTQ